MKGTLDRVKQKNHPFAVGGENKTKAKLILSDTEKVSNTERLISGLSQLMELETVSIEEIQNHLNHLGLRERKVAGLITKWATK